MQSELSSDSSSIFSFRKEPTSINEYDSDEDDNDETFLRWLSGNLEAWSEHTVDAVGVDRKRDVLKALSKPSTMKDTWKQLSTQLRDDKELLKIMRKEAAFDVRRKFSAPGSLSRTVREEIDVHRYIGSSLEKVLNRLEAKIKYKMDHYNDWRLQYDDAFAKMYYTGIWTHPNLSTTVTMLCYCCERILLADHCGEPVVILLTDLIVSAERCQVCSLLLRCSIDHISEDGNLRFLRNHAGIRADFYGPRLVRFSTDPNLSERQRSNVPIGRPLLPDADRTARFQLLRAWLQKCDQTHRCNERSGETVFPTRVLDVGGLQDRELEPGWIRLINAAERRTDTYIALSHCWGNLSNTQKSFCTSKDNMPRRRRGFHVSELPKTFQDAIKVSGDDYEDWNYESAQMKHVFSQAYCVIAATAAVDSLSGFLDTQEGRRTEYVCVQDRSERQFYISTDLDDFDNDVGKAKLNTRAWAMQELVLARRTIHFSANQIYWECGKGIHCENLTRLKSIPRNRYFMLDPEFPARLLGAFERDAMMNCIFYLIEEYSKRAITFPQDRLIAISGLEDRIAEALRCEHRFGVFDRYLHRNLLWMHTDNTKPSQHHASVPSWSWLSGSGAVIFDEEDESGTFELNTNIRFHPTRNQALLADLGVFVACTLQPRDERYEQEYQMMYIRDTAGSIKSWLSPDYIFWDADGAIKGWWEPDWKDSESFDNLHCVVVGQSSNRSNGKRYSLILAVVPTGKRDEYRRVGTGSVYEECIIRVQEGVVVV
ncbi:hypothetical protein OPT61_g5530 [Boeremia exigua]|uniref:Uncharacterized protein n=1 Tax=Boeremia exigua TaxID=749465 RepID=A0ACC2IA28_9PLEO|nr:hypothetical protein OPT61_g5530 [Boeremia exigua]